MENENMSAVDAALMVAQECAVNIGGNAHTLILESQHGIAELNPFLGAARILAAEVRRLREDSLRLAVFQHEAWDVYSLNGRWYVRRSFGKNHEGGTLREALDDAIESTPTERIDAARKAAK